ncbi:tetratricopeptide repeat-containing sulfotransferase family protein [Novosphingobium sp.]|uniref:tetratricopeptide repeat-containing sulfotransferase family protein n=1 Tax=Novosphingobium sp. TaxID=1874826 RepID=UPI003D0E2655
MTADSALTDARRALAQGDFARAARMAEAAGRADPRSAEPYFIMAMALAETGHVAHALGRVQRAVALDPDNAEYRAQDARLLILLQRDAEARVAATRAVALGSEDPLVLDTIGCVLARLGDHGAALPLFERAVAARPDTLSFRFNYASSLGFFGQAEQAGAQYEAMIARDPGNGQAHYGLAGLARQTPARNHIPRIEAAIPHARDHAAFVRLHYAAAKAHEDLGANDAAFAHLDVANRAHKARIGYDPQTDAALVRALRTAFERPGYFTGPGLPGAAPIFVVGLPRTGTTLVERILAAHPRVRSLGELQAMPLAVKRLSQSPSRLVLDAQTIAGAARLTPRDVAQAWLDCAQAQAGAPGGARLLDKFPLNFLYIGFIARAFPDARIVCLRRHPLDSVWSNFKHLFALGSPYYGFSYDLLDTARYYALFDGMMAFWRDRFPGQVMELGYEALLADQEGQTRALLVHCGLDWDPACLEFHTARGAVATPSAQQVRRPINRDSVDRWKGYAEHLAPAMAYLRAQGIA